MTKYDWSKVPDKVKWIASDKEGWLFPFSEKPVLGDEEWIGSIDIVMFFVLKANLKNHEGDWTQSLEQRPAQTDLPETVVKSLGEVA